MPDSTSGRRGLVRGLTLVPAASIILANIIGTGVFVKARVMICNVGSPTVLMAVWVVAGLLSLAGALTYAELGTMMPRAAGEFHFIGAAFGRRAAFLYGWTKTLAVGASAAAVSIVCVIFLNDVVGGRMPLWLQQALPVVLLVVGVGANLTTVRSSGLVATLLTCVKVGIVLAIGIGAFVFGDGNWSSFAEAEATGTCGGVSPAARGGVSGFGAAMLGALWGYNGWNVITGMGGEVRDPAKTIPRALIGGTCLVILLYLLINTAYFYLLSPSEVASIPESSSVARETVLRFAGAGAASLMAAGLVVSAYGTLHSTLLTGPRLPFALARHGLLPKVLGELSVNAVPAVAIVGLGVWSVVLALSGTFDILTDIYIFVLWIFYGMNGLSVFVLRRTWPEARRPYRAWGYPVVPALFLVVTAFLLINTLVATPVRAIAGLGLILSGLPVYAYMSRKLEPDHPEAWREQGDDVP